MVVQILGGRPCRGATLALAQVERVEASATDLRASAGEGTATDNVTAFLPAALFPIAVAVVPLVSSPRVAHKLRLTTPTGVPLLAETSKTVASYLTAERGLGRIALEADVDTLAVVLVGSTHLLAAGSQPAPVAPDDVRQVVSTALAAVIQEQQPQSLVDVGLMGGR